MRQSGARQGDTLSLGTDPASSCNSVLKHLRFGDPSAYKERMRNQSGQVRSGLELLRILALVAVATAAFGQSGGQHGKVAPDISLSNPNTLVDVIVQFKNAPTKDDLKKLGPYGQVKKIFNGIN